MLSRLKPILERALQYVVVFTSIPPFSWAYAAYYKLTLSAVVFTMRFFPEVVSVYVGGGGANGQVMLGLSDVDPLILVDGEDRRVRRTYSLLTVIFPLLKDKHSIRLVSEIDTWYRRPGRLAPNAPLQGALRKLYGKDSFPQHSELDDEQAFVDWISYSWSWVIRSVIFGSKNRLLRNYVCYKLLKKMGSPDLPAVGNPREVLHLSDLSEQTYRFGIEVIKNRTHLLNKAQPTPAKCTATVVDSSLQVSLTARSKQAVADAKELLEASAPGNTIAILIAAVTPLALDEENIGVFFAVAKAPGLETIRQLNTIFQRHGHEQYCSPYFLLDGAAYSTAHIDFDPKGNVILSWASHPLVFLALIRESAIVLGAPLDIDRGILIDHFNSCRERYLSKARTYITTSLAHPNIIRVPHLDFQMLFWQALQLKLIDEQGIYIFSSKDLCRAFCQVGESEWLKDMYAEYLKTLAGIPSDTEKFYQRALNFLATKT